MTNSAAKAEGIEIFCGRCLSHMSGPVATRGVAWDLCEECRLNWWLRRFKWMHWFDRLIVRLILGSHEKYEDEELEKP